MVDMNRLKGPYQISGHRTTLYERDGTPVPLYLIYSEEEHPVILYVPVGSEAFAEKIVIALNAVAPYDYEGLRRNALHYAVNWFRITASFGKSVLAGTIPERQWRWKDVAAQMESDLRILGLKADTYTMQEDDYGLSDEYTYIG